jgi:predicted GNAT family acetyltransferase
VPTIGVMHVRRVSEPAEFLRLAGPLLTRDEARHNLLLGLAATLHEEPAVFTEHHLWIAEDDEGGVVGAALETPPHNLVLACPTTRTAAGALACSIHRELPGIVGAEPEVYEFASVWSALRQVTAEISVRQGLYKLDRVNEIESAPGALRWATQDDRQLIQNWFREFAVEALYKDKADEAEIARTIERRVAQQTLALWEADDEVVALAGLQGRTPHGIRIGPVYTPVRHRGRGYATSLVATLSNHALGTGRRFCMLYTDLANPTSNRIYERIGYELVCESAEFAFMP